MNRLAAILPAINVLLDVDATSKKRTFENAGVLFENQHAIARATVTDNLHGFVVASETCAFDLVGAKFSFVKLNPEKSGGPTRRVNIR